MNKEFSAEDVIGMNLDAAKFYLKGYGVDYRVVRIDEHPMVVTCDLIVDRANLEVDGGVVTVIYYG